MQIQGQFAFSLFTRSALVVVLALTSSVNATLPETLKWTGGNFEWPCSTTRNMFKSSGKYVSKNVIATRVALFENKAIVALPRYKLKRLIELMRETLHQNLPLCRIWPKDGFYLLPVLTTILFITYV